jgi:hypothetical protein
MRASTKIYFFYFAIFFKYYSTLFHTDKKQAEMQARLHLASGFFDRAN